MDLEPAIRIWLDAFQPLQERERQAALIVEEMHEKRYAKLEAAYHKAMFDRLYLEDRYASLEAVYYELIGVALNFEERYRRWVEQIEDHLLFTTRSPEEIEQFKKDLVRRVEGYRAQTKWRRTRGRKVGSKAYPPQERARLAARARMWKKQGQPWEEIAHRLKLSEKTIREYVREYEAGELFPNNSLEGRPALTYAGHKARRNLSDADQ